MTTALRRGTAVKIPTTQLEPGMTVLTTGVIGTDFTLPLVAPHTRKRDPAHTRTVRNRAHTQGGMVVWFTDGTKSTPLHGRTAWQSPDEPEGDTLW